MAFIFIAFVVLFVLIAFGIWLTFNILGLIITLIVAGFVGWLADKVVPGRLPYGLFGAVVAGLLGSWLGGALLDDLGPTIAGISLIPAFLGALILAFFADLVLKNRAEGRRA